MADDTSGLLINADKSGEDTAMEEIGYFSDGKRRIDFIMAYNDDPEESDYEHKKEDREFFYETLREFKLQFEDATSAVAKSGYGAIKTEDDKDKEPKVHFIKIHAPIDVLYDCAEDVKMKMPTSENDIDIKEWYEDNGFYRFLMNLDPFKLRNPTTQETKNYFVATFDKDRLGEFHNHDDPDKFFTAAERGRLVYYILEKAKFGDKPTDIGIGNLVHHGVFLDAFPLHDGTPLNSLSDTPVNDRQRLQKDWANSRCLFRYQPISAIREYFGEKIALYFSWLGFYTGFLIPASIVGLLCFIYGVVSAEGYPPVKEVCQPPHMKDNKTLFYMCPLCDKRCPYYNLSAVSCTYAKITHYFDNEATIFFAAFMSIWATMFLEFWKRKQITLAYEWHSMGFETTEEQVRPEYIALNPNLKRNPVTGRSDMPMMTARKRVTRMFGTFGVVAFFVILVIFAALGVVIFRGAFAVLLVATGQTIVIQRSKMIVSGCAGVLNLVAINILKFVYKKVAVWLTDWENPRTRTDYDDSFTIKMFSFQFVNTYSSIIYVAFFKGTSVTGFPGNYNRMGSGKLRFRLDGCSAQGCFLELTIQLVIIMVGQQIIGNVFEVIIPTTMKWWNDRKSAKETIVTEQPQWVDDYEGEMQTKFSLFWEYLEIVLQYGFVTMFVAGFPLAPLFALLNNVIEIRVDAFNYIRNCRRPVAQRAEDIGAWYGILAMITNVSIVINACVIAFTSEMIPRLTYKYTESATRTLYGFTNYSLSYFYVSDFTEDERPWNGTGRATQPWCRYRGYHASHAPYPRSLDYWKILCSRLAFVLAFVFFVLSITWAIGYIIPDTPRCLDLKIKREKFLESKADKEHKEKSGKRKPRPADDPDHGCVDSPIHADETTETSPV